MMVYISPHKRQSVPYHSGATTMVLPNLQGGGDRGLDRERDGLLTFVPIPLRLGSSDSHVPMEGGKCTGEWVEGGPGDRLCGIETDVEVNVQRRIMTSVVPAERQVGPVLCLDGSSGPKG